MKDQIMNELGKVVSADTFRIERSFKAPPERVWSYLVDAEKRSRWFNAGDDITATGQDFEMHFGHHRITEDKPPAKFARFDGTQPDMVMKTRVLAFEPPRLLRIAWPEGKGGPSEVTFELSPQNGGTKLVLTHAKLASRGDMLSVSGGWTAHLDVLGQELAGEPHRGFWAAIERYEPQYDQLIPR
jgi:uncharacterized protein YndB with AHSA1/START domain